MMGGKRSRAPGPENRGKGERKQGRVGRVDREINKMTLKESFVFSD
jgi:hypothetical protein